MAKAFKLPIIFLSLLLFMACDEEQAEPNDRSYLIAGNTAFGKTWRVSQIEVSFGTVSPHPCVTDNFITYFPDGNYEINEGATKCSPTDPPAVTGVWTLNSFETKIFVELGDSLQTWNIQAIDKNSQRISSEFNEGERIYVLSLVN